MRKIALAALLLGLGMASASAESAPDIGVGSLRDVPYAVRRPYDPATNADAAVDAALAKARASGKRVLLDLGGNWCPDCIVLANVMELPAARAFIEKHFEVVAIDVGRFDKNIQVLERFGLTKRSLKGVPFVMIVDSEGKLLNTGEGLKVADAASMRPQRVLELLARWTD